METNDYHGRDGEQNKVACNRAGEVCREMGEDMEKLAMENIEIEVVFKKGAVMCGQDMQQN